MPTKKVPVNLSPPDISAYRQGNTGVEYITRIDSGNRMYILTTKRMISGEVLK